MGANLSFPDVDLSGKVAVVTGGNTGIGYETSKSLAIMGAHTIIACRSEQRATTAIEQMRREIEAVYPDKNVKIEYMHLDLASFRSTKDFTVAFKERNLSLHILINNAGVLMFNQPLTVTEDGNEIQFQVNHLSHFLLTLELLPTVLNTASSTGDGRIIILSSMGHKSGVLDPENLNGERSNEGWSLYCNSKFFNVLHGYALQRRLQNVGVTVSSVHPGFVNSELFNREDGGGAKMAVMKGLMSVLKHTPAMRNTQDGAATTLNCAVNPANNKQEHHYYASCKITPSIPTSRDEGLQEQLWEISIERVKDWISPELLAKYGGRVSSQQQEVTATPTSADQSEVTPPTTGNKEAEITAKSDSEATPTVDETKTDTATDSQLEERSEVTETGSEVKDIGSEVTESGSEVTETVTEVKDVGSEVTNSEVKDMGSEVTNSEVTESGSEVTETGSEVNKTESETNETTEQKE